MVSCLVVYGLSKNGKSFTSQILAKNLNVKLIPFDEIINFISEYIRIKNSEKHPAIDFKSYFIPRIFKNNENAIEDFKADLDILISKNEKFFNNFYKNLIQNKFPLIDSRPKSEIPVNIGRNGDVLDPYAEDILKMVIKHIVQNSSFFIIEGFYFNEGKNYREKIKNLCNNVSFLGCFYKLKESTYLYKLNGVGFTDLNYIKEKLDIEINPKHKSYQSFSSESDSDSRSYEKLMKLGIPEDLKGKIVLDLGCNEGFFCFECEKRGAKVIGIEGKEKWYDLALKRKNILSSFVNFINDDWNCIPLLNYKFDLVLFLAAFHYIKNNQLEMLRSVYHKINNDGLLILEVGLLNKNEGTFLIEDVTRPVGDVCQFTNKFTIEKLLKDAGFRDITIYGHGTAVIGDDIPRYVIHARKSTQNKKKIDQERKSKKLLNQDLESINNKNEVGIYEIANVLLTLYNRSPFCRVLFKLGHKILKKTIKE